MHTNVLLLTATITPPAGVPSLSRVDPGLRRRDYVEAFAFYLGLLGSGVDRIVLAENSGSDLGDFERMTAEADAGDRVELIGFEGLDHPPSYGRAYGEFKLVDHAMARSRLIAEAGTEAIVWKNTGRYITRNLDRFIARRPRDFDLYCNLRSYPRPWADMYLLAWTRRGHDGFLKGICEQLRGDALIEERGREFSPENRFRELIDEARPRLKVAPRFRVIPEVEGVRGFDNRHYAQGANRAKFLARRVAHRVAPWIWI